MERFQKHLDAMATGIDNMDWRKKEVYGAFCAQTYYYVRHSTRLIALAAAHFSQKDNKAHQRFLRHISEENNHEVLAIRDLQALGYEIGDFLELSSLKAFYRNQYFEIQHRSPWAFLGYVMALESLAVSRGKRLHEIVTRYHGNNCASFLKVHAAEDVEHIEQVFNLVRNLEEPFLIHVEESLELSVAHYVQMLKDLPRAFVGKIRAA